MPSQGNPTSTCIRILCDVTAKGKAVIERVLDVKLEVHDASNGGKKDDPHIGSLLLPYEFVTAIAAFALLSETGSRKFGF
jgi:hypothetical protein